MKLFEKNAAELSAMLQNKECSAVELTKDVLDRIDAKESAVGAYVTRCEDCLEQAEAVDNARAAGEELRWQASPSASRTTFPQRASARPVPPKCWKTMFLPLMQRLCSRFAKLAWLSPVK